VRKKGGKKKKIRRGGGKGKRMERSGRGGGGKNGRGRGRGRGRERGGGKRRFRKTERLPPYESGTSVTAASNQKNTSSIKISSLQL
jgi:hypothetical protein